MSTEKSARWQMLQAIAQNEKNTDVQRARARGGLDEMNYQYMRYLKKEKPEEYHKRKVKESKEKMEYHAERPEKKNKK